MTLYTVIIDLDYNHSKTFEVKADSINEVRKKYFRTMFKTKNGSSMVFLGQKHLGGFYKDGKVGVRWANAGRATTQKNWVSPITGALVSKETYFDQINKMKGNRMKSFAENAIDMALFMDVN